MSLIRHFSSYYFLLHFGGTYYINPSLFLKHSFIFFLFFFRFGKDVMFNLSFISYYVAASGTRKRNLFHCFRIYLLVVVFFSLIKPFKWFYFFTFPQFFVPLFFLVLMFIRMISLVLSD